MITLYTTLDCPHCDAARRWLRERGVPFSEVRILEEENGVVLHQALVHAGRPRVPVIEVGAEVLVGFDAGRLEELLAAEGEVVTGAGPEEAPRPEDAGPGEARAAGATDRAGAAEGGAGESPDTGAGPGEPVVA